MPLPFKTRLIRKRVLVSSLAGTLAVLAVFILRQGALSTWDDRLLDRYYRAAVTRGKGPPVSEFPAIRYVTLTDDTYAAMGKNYLDRSVMARVNQVLGELGAASVAYDIIFAQPAQEGQDRAFAASLSAGPPVFLPVGLRLVPEPVPFEGKTGQTLADLARPLRTSGDGHPFFAAWALTQSRQFDTRFSGHITSLPDPDGTVRRLPLVVRINDGFFPALSLAVFLDAMGVPFEALEVDWGRALTIPAVKGSRLSRPLSVPIDRRGLALIPFPRTWEKGFQEMPAHKLLAMAGDENLSGNLADFFEGSIVFVGDISTGISDLGDTPVQDNVPLVMAHTAMVNGLLTHTFYHTLPLGITVLGVILMGLVTGAAALLRPSWPLFLSGPVLVGGVLASAWAGMVHLVLVPVFSLSLAGTALAGLLILVTESALSRERSRIRNMFTRYVPQKVVTHLLANPERVKMGGEMREITILMSDLRGFTALSAVREPGAVIHILNRYLEQMVDIIMDHGGVIDEIIGDGILAFFGAPEPAADHPARAVACALAMQQAMAGINQRNRADGLPSLAMGIGINTGSVIVGNIGSERRTKYGAVGAEVNITGRVESYTIGGQILITRATRDRLGDWVRVGQTLTVEMKGMPDPVPLFSVTGLGGPWGIFLETAEEVLVCLNPGLPVTVRRVAGKTVTGDAFSGTLTRLSPSSACLASSQAFSPMDNLIFYPEPGAGEGVYAKVAALLPSEQVVKIIFTAVPGTAESLFRQLLEKPS